MFVVALVLYAAATVLGLLGSVGMDVIGPFGTIPLAVACTAAGLGVCHAGHPARAHG